MASYQNITSSDRLTISVFIASLVHAFFILAVSFDFPKPSSVSRSLEVTLVNAMNRQAPEKADFLAQENQVASGIDRKKPKLQPQIEKKVSSSVNSVKRGVDRKKANVVTKKALVQEHAKYRIDVQQSDEIPLQKTKKKITAEALAQQISQLGAEIIKSHENYSKRPKIMYINSVNAHKYKAASYEAAWQEKVERIGNLNYPDEARRKNLSGALLLSVGVKPDGSIYSIKVHRSSGHKALDDAAVRIVRLASPFAPFPDELKEEADILVITRTWKFFNNYRMKTSR